jgi:aminopeptidase N
MLGHKATYTAAVTVPAWATVLMSALATGVEGAAAGASQGERTFKWSQPVACSSYLVSRWH